MPLWTVLLAESKRAWILGRRYPLQLAGELLTGVLIVGALLVV